MATNSFLLHRFIVLILLEELDKGAGRACAPNNSLKCD